MGQHASSYTINDVDTHVTEDPGVFVDRVPAAMRDRVPYVKADRRGRDTWFLGDQRMGAAGLSATAGRGDMKDWPATYADMHPGAHNAKARLEYMDQTGIWSMVMYPNVAGFGSQAFLKLGDPELMLACVEAYNNWQTEWASADPRRLLPATSTPFWDIDAAVAEVERCAAMGHKGILFTGEPHAFGLPMLGDPHWDPLWRAAVEVGSPISFHIGSGNMEAGLGRKQVEAYGRMATFAAGSVNLFLANGFQLMDLLISGVLARHPDIKFVSVESGIGWIPFALEALDYQFLGNRVSEDRPELDRLPSEYFASNVYACYWFEQIAPRRLIDKVGVDHILFETDFPHPTCLYGDEVNERIEAGLGDSDAETRHKILWANAQKLYRIDEPTAADNRRLAGLATAAN
ncbi:MAG: amidohydrolase family protein [Acidimicrobiales bacterium]|jgi:predicted TIM-barrel fold metal-dependent hydrolase